MSQDNLYVSLTLDRERRLKLTIHDVDEILDRVQRQGGPEVNTFDLLVQLGGLRWKAYAATLWAGLRHEDPKISNPERARALLDKYLQDGGELAPVAWAIKRAMLLSGAINFDLWSSLSTPEERALYGEGDPRKVTELAR